MGRKRRCLLLLLLSLWFLCSSLISFPHAQLEISSPRANEEGELKSGDVKISTHISIY